MVFPFVSFLWLCWDPWHEGIQRWNADTGIDEVLQKIFTK
jgi:hypothetical protein